MATTAPSNPTPKPEASFSSLTALLAPDGLVGRKLNPPPSRRALKRHFKVAGIPRWKFAKANAGGSRDPYFETAAVQHWLESATTTNA